MFLIKFISSIIGLAYIYQRAAIKAPNKAQIKAQIKAPIKAPNESLRRKKSNYIYSKIFKYKLKKPNIFKYYKPYTYYFNNIRIVRYFGKKNINLFYDYGGDGGNLLNVLLREDTLTLETIRIIKYLLSCGLKINKKQYGNTSKIHYPILILEGGDFIGFPLIRFLQNDTKYIIRKILITNINKYRMGYIYIN